MLRSMTGFGAASSEAEPGSALRVEVRSVNHRHLALKLRLPDVLAALEPEIEARVRAKCERGAVTVSFTSEQRPGSGAAHLDHGLARRYRAELLALAQELELAPEFTLDTLVALPGVVTTDLTGAAGEDLHAAALALVEQALEGMLAMRASEGRALATDLRKNARTLAQLAARIGKRMPRVVRAHHAALAKRVQDLLGGRTPVAREDLAREVALLADKLDVSEELARLASHLEQLEGFLEKGGRAGRSLDFLVQEIFREVNTIGSKCSDATVTHWVVEAKVHVERLREQVQNVE